MPNFYDERHSESPSGRARAAARAAGYAARYATGVAGVTGVGRAEGSSDDEVTEWVTRGAYMEGDEEDGDEDPGDGDGSDGADGAEGDAAGDSTLRLYKEGLRELDTQGLQDIGGTASWWASSHKQGYPVGNVRDDSPHTFWQSDGQLPHSIIVRFTKRQAIERVSLFVSYLHDESYTPSAVSVFAGTGDHDLAPVRTFHMDSPLGWRHITFEDTTREGILKCSLVKLVFLANHQNGKDTHLRALKVMARREDRGEEGELGWTGVLLRESCIR